MSEMPEIDEVELSSSPPESSKSEIPKIALIQVLCTIAIILAMYAFSNRTILAINEKIDSQEYSKVWGEENYKMLQEIQKDQVNSMIRDYSVTNPEYIEQIKKKIRSESNEDGEKLWVKNRLTSDEITSLKSQALILGNSGAHISLIEFSDFTCDHCREFHNKKILSQAESSSSWSINLIFKSTPWRKNLEGLQMATMGRCTYMLSGSLAYANFVDAAFAEENLTSKWFNSSGAINYIVKKLWVNEAQLKQCEASMDTKAILDREFWQSIYLGIWATPSTLVVNSKTGYYLIVAGNVDQILLNQAIKEVANN